MRDDTRLPGPRHPSQKDSLHDRKRKAETSAQPRRGKGVVHRVTHEVRTKAPVNEVVATNLRLVDA